MPKLNKNIQTFIQQSPTVYHACKSITTQLEQQGFSELHEADVWKLERGTSYYVVREGSAVIAWRQGSTSLAESGFAIVGAHTDSPSLKIKMNAQEVSCGMLRCATEVYGGPIISSWLDRPLALAGQVMVKSKEGWEPRLCHISAVATIANSAIHLNREINKGFEYNKQNHLQALFGLARSDAQDDFIQEKLAVFFKVEKTCIGAGDLFLVADAEPTLVGLNNEMLLSPRIDNLAMCHAIVESFAHSPKAAATSVGLFLNHEEIGSTSSTGADGSFVATMLRRIVECNDSSNQAYYRSIARSFMVSADGAHAQHPNFQEKHDKAYAPFLGGGPVIKESANYRYATTARATQYFIDMCRESSVEYQLMCNRSDIPSGSTIGPMTTAHLGVAGIDVGSPMLAMHSSCELAAMEDHRSMIKVLTRFFDCYAASSYHSKVDFQNEA